MPLTNLQQAHLGLPDSSASFVTRLLSSVPATLIFARTRSRAVFDQRNSPRFLPLFNASMFVRNVEALICHNYQGAWYHNPPASYSRSSSMCGPSDGRHRWSGPSQDSSHFGFSLAGRTSSFTYIEPTRGGNLKILLAVSTRHKPNVGTHFRFPARRSLAY